LLKTTASCVLAALKASAYKHRVRLAFSLAAASLEGLFDHPAGYLDSVYELHNVERYQVSR
jgi:hypothetical protein